ncbi:hypothetical protein [Sphingomonas prati]|uniref:Uncharacterized protein n=1 Tax=Sphingomonas prati TaxID=1843237 RepID=A0A7W9BR26_9SPHN|nr:hypothetical protein [Sphingomonas prati]MBB5728063.1 hypothetical protein [Sphingomonas prati]GGE82965.1 hypothetical protein GCM10011404_14580 [Sphingomonas prati]
MSDTVPTPVPGNPETKGQPDGVSGSPGNGEPHGRSVMGESGGAAYPNPHSKTADVNDDSPSTDQSGEPTEDISEPGTVIGTIGSEVADRDRPLPVPAPDRQTREVKTETGSFTVLETDGVAQAATTGKIGTDAPYEREQEQPGSG